MSKKSYPKWVYHINQPQGKIIHSENELHELRPLGWVESPDSIELERGWEYANEQMPKMAAGQAKKAMAEEAKKSDSKGAKKAKSVENTSEDDDLSFLNEEDESGNSFVS